MVCEKGKKHKKPDNYNLRNIELMPYNSFKAIAIIINKFIFKSGISRLIKCLFIVSLTTN